MKIKVKDADYDEVIKKATGKRPRPDRQMRFLKWLVAALSVPDFWATHFKYTLHGMEKLGKDEPCLILMNHSSFIDLKIAFKVFRKRRFNIVCTSDGFVGLGWVMKKLGCIATQKFVPDVQLIRDMVFATKTLRQSILMYPEASYTFDGTATDLPETLGNFLKLLDVPVVMIRTYGAFHRQPLYNNLHIRKVDVSADVTYLLSPEQIKNSTKTELNEILKKQFSFDNFEWQQENNIKITELFRADYLNRVLYKCPACGVEGKMSGKGISVVCGGCGKVWELTEDGFMKATSGETEYPHIPDWYRWERSCVRKEIEDGTYLLDVDCDIYMLVDTKCIYRVGSGHLLHNNEGFHLTGCDGRLDYSQKPKGSYSLYSDYYWYEIGDMICIGTPKVLYYCFPKNVGDIVAKTRLATEEMYRASREVKSKM